MRKIQTAMILCATCFSAGFLFAQAEATPPAAPDASVLNETQWEQLDQAVDRGLTWLATKQRADGSFDSIDLGQPGVTSFCVMAFLAQGESPIDGKYQQQLSKAIDFIANQQKPNGLIAFSAPSEVPIERAIVRHTETPKGAIGRTVVYNHAISALTICEAYGQCSPEQSKKLAPVIKRAIAATLEMQAWGPKSEKDVGGWRYLYRHGADKNSLKSDSDLSVSGWQLMFLRSARNAGFDVPKESIDNAVKYIENCYLAAENRKVHGYLTNNSTACTRAMAGAGILAMAHAGKHDSEAAIGSGEWILKHDFKDYNNADPVYQDRVSDRYHYGAVVCSQAMFQLGGKFWKQFFPPLVDTLLANQKADGSWPRDRSDRRYGNCYSTSLSILSLTVPNQMLPIFQR